MIIEAQEYGLRHPLVRAPGSNWVVVGSTFWPRPRSSHSLDVHYDADDPLHVFLDAREWAPLPNAKKLAKAYNLLHTKAVRLRLRRSVEATKDIADMIEAEVVAAGALKLARLIRVEPDDAHLAAPWLEYYPNGQVWKDGERWVLVKVGRSDS